MILEKYFQKKIGHNRGPPQQTYYWGSWLLMDYSIEKIVWMLFVYWVLKRHHIFWEIWYFLEFQKNGAKKVKKRKVLAKERKRKGENGFGKCLLPKKS